MSEEMNQREKKRRKFSEEVGKKEKRRIKAKKNKAKSIWFGLGMFGLVGWAVSVPTLIGIAVGLWIDNKWPGPISWTLVFLFFGIVLGCLNAWFWVAKERSHIEDKENNE